MSRPWFKTKKILEDELLCDSLKGRVSYFCTRYHGAPDHYGRFCVRVDGKEYVMANPYNEKYVDQEECRIKEEENIPPREWDEHGCFLHEEENLDAENRARKIAMTNNTMEEFQPLWAIEDFLNQDIAVSLHSDNEFIRLLAVLDRRTGKRTLADLKNKLDEQPEWLRFFYELRLNAENI